MKCLNNKILAKYGTVYNIYRWRIYDKYRIKADRGNKFILL